MADNLFYHYPLGLKNILWCYINANNEAVILGISIFEKMEKTVQSNRSVYRVRKKDRHPIFSVATWNSNFILYFYNALDVSSPKTELILYKPVFFISRRRRVV